MKNKLTIYIDMDGVLANFDKAAKENPHIKRPDLHLDFSTFDPKHLDGAKVVLLQ
jgi:hypothetical protein